MGRALENQRFVLGSFTRAKKKEVQTLVQHHGGKVVYAAGKRVSAVICPFEEDNYAGKNQNELFYHIPVILLDDFVPMIPNFLQCIQDLRSRTPDAQVQKTAETGDVPHVIRYTTEFQLFVPRGDVSLVLIWADFWTKCTLADNDEFAVLELQSGKSSLGDHVSCVFLHTGASRDLSLHADNIGKRTCAYFSELSAAEDVFQEEALKLATQGFSMSTLRRPSRLLGSELAVQRALPPSTLDPRVQELVARIFTCARSAVSTRGCHIDRVTHADLDEASSALSGLLALFSASPVYDSDGDEIPSDAVSGSLPRIEQLEARLQVALGLPSTPACRDVEAVKSEMEFVQLLRDQLGVEEEIGGGSTVDNMLRALSCDVVPVDVQSDTFSSISSLFLHSQDDDEPESWFPQITGIFRLARRSERQRFRFDIPNKRLLFHGTSLSNALGILSRGLLLPEKSVDAAGNIRTDAGMLGAGLYFASHASVSAQYCFADSVESNIRLMFVSLVALGNEWETTRLACNLSAPPNSCHSVHGVKSRHGRPSVFRDDEFVVYNREQQMLQFVIQFTTGVAPLTSQGPFVGLNLSEYLTEDLALAASMVNATADCPGINLMSNAASPPIEVEPVTVGLQDAEGTRVPLLSVHVRASVMDYVARVYVFQEYFNHSSKVLEVKFVFPLDSLASVCGMEAFIGDRHILGVVKEKEQAHREYEAAVDDGHGAYLMDQSVGDVFTVSVGNLPAQTRCCIKITYVTHLTQEGDRHRFSLPCTVAPTHVARAVAPATQSQTATVDAAGNAAAATFSVIVGFQMSRVISDISSSHAVQTKQTATVATVELKPCGATGLDRDLSVLVKVEDSMSPTLLVEEDPSGSRAAMLVIHPNLTQLQEEEGVSVAPPLDALFLLDCSASMAGTALQDAVRVIYKCIIGLPKDSTFNVIAFGTSFLRVFPSNLSVSLSDTLSRAEAWLQRRLADGACMGGSNVLDALTAIASLVSQRSEERQRPRQTDTAVFVASDGHVRDVTSVLDVLGKCTCTGTRSFWFGVGKDVDRHTLLAAARAGAGYTEFVPPSCPESTLDNMIFRQLKRASLPALSQAAVSWGADPDDAAKCVQAPARLSSLFHGDVCIVYAFVGRGVLQAVLTARRGVYAETVTVHTSEAAIVKGSLIHTMAARASIRDWEDGLAHDARGTSLASKELRKSAITAMSIKYGVLTPWTSFVAIEERSTSDPVDHMEVSLSDLLSAAQVDLLAYVPWPVAREDQATASDREYWASVAERCAHDPDFFASTADLSRWLCGLLSSSTCSVQHARALCGRLVQQTVDLIDEARLAVRKNRYVAEKASKDAEISCGRALIHFEESIIASEAENDISAAHVKCELLRALACSEQLLAVAKGLGKQPASVQATRSTFEHYIDTYRGRLNCTDPALLELILSHARFLQCIGDKEAACKVAQQGFNEAISDLDCLSEESYKDSTTVMQMMRDFVTSSATEEVARSPVRSPRRRPQVTLNRPVDARSATVNLTANSVPVPKKRGKVLQCLDKAKAPMARRREAESVCDILLLDVIPLSIGIEVTGGLYFPVICRNTTIPTKKTTPILAGPSKALVNVYEGERSLATTNNFLGSLEIPPSTNRDWRTLEISLDIDANGVLHVQALDLASRDVFRLVVTNDKGRLTKEDIENMVHSARSEAVADQEVQARVIATYKPPPIVGFLDARLSRLQDCVVWLPSVGGIAEELLGLQCADTGVWDLSDDVCSVLGLSRSGLEEKLFLAGLRSLGPDVVIGSFRALATSLVVALLTREQDDIYHTAAEGGRAAVLLFDGKEPCIPWRLGFEQGTWSALAEEILGLEPLKFSAKGEVGPIDVSIHPPSTVDVHEAQGPQVSDVQEAEEANSIVATILAIDFGKDFCRAILCTHRDGVDIEEQMEVPAYWCPSSGAVGLEARIAARHDPSAVLTPQKEKFGNPEDATQHLRFTTAVFKHVKEWAESRSRDSVVDGVVLTCPTDWGDRPRQCLKDAGSTAGLNVFRIVNESMSTATAFGLDNINDEVNLILVHIGAESTRCTALMVEEGIFETVATATSIDISGRAFVRTVASHIINEDRSKLLPTSSLYRACETGLSECSSQLRVEVPTTGEIKKISLVALRSWFREVFLSLRSLVERTVSGAKWKWESIECVSITGAAARNVGVKEAFLDAFAQQDCSPTVLEFDSVDPSFVVAKGALKVANYLCPTKPEIPKPRNAHPTHATSTPVVMPCFTSTPSVMPSFISTPFDGTPTIEEVD